MLLSETQTYMSTIKVGNVQDPSSLTSLSSFLNSCRITKRRLAESFQKKKMNKYTRDKVA